ncbi:hypothetical protein IQ64_47440 [Streptomyces stelliscabiei]|nr:hypothetical protein IQ64_47440 [Streptomyces stelliscabiei]SOD65633.1 hypothetical protein SAMN06272781_0261 [Streptomyces sp. 1222.2]
MLDRGGEIAPDTAREVELATAIVTHACWSEFVPADILAARDAPSTTTTSRWPAPPLPDLKGDVRFG